MFQLSAVKTGTGGSKMKTKNVFYVSGIIMAGVFALSFAKPMAVNAMMGQYNDVQANSESGIGEGSYGARS